MVCVDNVDGSASISRYRWPNGRHAVLTTLCAPAGWWVSWVSAKSPKREGDHEQRNERGDDPSALGGVNGVGEHRHDVVSHRLADRVQQQEDPQDQEDDPYCRVGDRFDGPISAIFLGLLAARSRLDLSFCHSVHSSDSIVSRCRKRDSDTSIEKVSL